MKTEEQSPPACVGIRNCPGKEERKYLSSHLSDCRGKFLLTPMHKCVLKPIVIQGTKDKKVMARMLSPTHGWAWAVGLTLSRPGLHLGCSCVGPSPPLSPAVQVVSADSIPDGWMALDIGPDSVKT